MGTCYDIIKSWATVDDCLFTTEELMEWISKLNYTTYVEIHEENINEDTFWFYDDYNGEVLNRKRSFFSIKGMRRFENGYFVGEQPIIIQPEIGYLGIIGKRINGILYFLMQAKVEPGNVNCVQLSPTIQATKSNFTRAHGGNLPAYFELFENSEKYEVIYDQLQSEQSARFYKKRNRNMIMIVDEDIVVLPNFRWMTLGQIKQMMEIDNLVNMDTRTVLSGIPLLLNPVSEEEKIALPSLFTDNALYKSIFESDPLSELPWIFHSINNYKMFEDVNVVPVPLNQLVDWEIDQYGITCKKQANFMVRYYKIQISGREVQCWTQPLFKAIGMATFGLLTKVVEGKRKFLIRIKPEIGTFDKIEVGPTVQWEPTHYIYNDDAVEKTFRSKYEMKEKVLVDVVLSEEGGRFYHEQNHNVIIEINSNVLDKLPDEYLWVDFGTLNYMVQFNNCLNIQLRNLISLIKL